MAAFNDTSSALSLLATRRSGKARDLVAPGPDDRQLHDMLSAAIRVPDHGKLTPWRFVTLAAGQRAALGEAFVEILAREKPDASALELDLARNFATLAPTLVVVLSRTSPEKPIPVWEQELSAGAATMLLCLAAHAHGFAANWLTGWAAYSPGVLALLGQTGERIAGFIFIGTPAKPLDERVRPDFDAVVREWRP